MTVSDGLLRPSAAGPARTRDARRQALDPSRDKAIAGADFQVLAELGYRGLTMDEVALAAGVGKGAIYRRWSSKADLLVSFLEAASDSLPGRPRPHSTISIVPKAVCTLLDSVAGCAVPTTLPAGTGHTSLAIKVSYLRPVRHGDGILTATGRMTTPGRRAAFADAEVRDHRDRLIATASSTCLVFPLPDE